MSTFSLRVTPSTTPAQNIVILAFSGTFGHIRINKVILLRTGIININTLHGISFPRGRLPIGKYRAIVSLQYLLKYGFGCHIVHILLAAVLVKHVIKSEDVPLLTSLRHTVAMPLSAHYDLLTIQRVVQTDSLADGLLHHVEWTNSAENLYVFTRAILFKLTVVVALTSTL